MWYIISVKIGFNRYIHNSSALQIAAQIDRILLAVYSIIIQAFRFVSQKDPHKAQNAF